MNPVWDMRLNTFQMGFGAFILEERGGGSAGNKKVTKKAIQSKKHGFSGEKVHVVNLDI